MPKPTAEQAAAVDAFSTRDDLVLQAGAGTGKTTTLTMLAAGDRRPGKYLAFNRSIAHAAKRVFPQQVDCRTAHSLAFAGVGHRYAHRLGGARVPSWKIGERLGMRPMSIAMGARKVTHKAVSYTALQTVIRFCQSSADEIGRHHVPHLRGLDPDWHHHLVDLALPYAHRAWADVQNPESDIVKFGHDHYLKIWALQRPHIPGDFLLLDEAQDTNPVVERVFLDQRHHAQLVMVGDSAQAIYGWRGARDVMTDFDGNQLTLSRSFRFGPALATEANRWLRIVDAPLRLTGTTALNTELGPVDRPDAILCRTNAGSILEIMQLLEQGTRVGLVGGGGPLKSLALAAQDLKAGRRTSHHELFLFESWGEVQEYAEEDPGGRDLKPFVDLIDDVGPEAVLAAVDALTDEKRADILVSTAHKAKGREWDTVRIGDDFADCEPEDIEADDGHAYPGYIPDTEARLAYVAVTRARHRLDLGGLNWINQHPDGQPDTGEAGPGHQPPDDASPWDSLGHPPA
ncbi:UvrD-helicase domain-containing protein [Embleya hyalina]|uniref:DNA helicase n=1 Tax=Embleya hyalina TaxID=516124 RepID=A0A401Z417_9ACTN|nr:UvrD-helicase domain-containing protein [Embleya hyalina]GCE01590.1 DNA helicase [Embleya hyalina]